MRRVFDHILFNYFNYYFYNQIHHLFIYLLNLRDENINQGKVQRIIGSAQ
jgi:hypothetical protein